MKYLIVEFSRDWADEFSMEGFETLTSDEWEALQKRILSQGEINYSFGTNEGWEEENPKDFLSSYSTKEISLEQYNILKELFPKGNGLFPSIDDFENPDELGDEEEKEDDPENFF